MGSENLLDFAVGLFCFYHLTALSYTHRMADGRKVKTYLTHCLLVGKGCFREETEGPGGRDTF